MIHQSLIYRDAFGTDAMRRVWTEEAMVQRWLDVEAAVALAEGELEIIPRSVARTIARHCAVGIVSPDAIAAWHRKTGHVIVSLVKAFRDAAHGAGESFHLGPTTQDILDTGLTLQIRDSLRELVAAVFELERVLWELAERHQHTVLMGRTEGQHAVPITFGYKVAVLASEIGDHLTRLAGCAERLMVLTLFGATGVQSSFTLLVGPRGTRELVRRVGRRLHLPVPVICPHHRTDRFAELGHVLASLLSTLGEAGLEVRDLQRTEVGEVAEPWTTDQHSSSTMPQKQNPETSEWLDGLASLARGYAVALLDIQQQHERDITRLAPELHAIPNLFLLTSAAVESATRIFRGLRVDAARMRANLLLSRGLAMSEPVMLALARKSGRKVWAHQLCHDVAMTVSRDGSSFGDALLQRAEIRRYLSPQDITRLLAPERYTGTAASQAAASARVAARRRRALMTRFDHLLGTTRQRRDPRRSTARSE